MNAIQNLYHFSSFIIRLLYERSWTQTGQDGYELVHISVDLADDFDDVVFRPGRVQLVQHV